MSDWASTVHSATSTNTRIIVYACSDSSIRTERIPSISSVLTSEALREASCAPRTRMASEGSLQRTESYELPNISQCPLPPAPNPPESSPSEPAQPIPSTTVPAAAATDSGRPSTSNPPHALVNINSQISTCSKTKLAQAWASLRSFSRAKGDIILKLIAVITFVITVVAFWSGITSASDGHKSELIAEWTARKDFIEAFEAVSTCTDLSYLLCLHISFGVKHDWSTPACERAKGTQLDAPPNFYRTDWKRYIRKGDVRARVRLIDGFIVTRGKSTRLGQSLWMPISACMFLSLRRKIARAVKDICRALQRSDHALGPSDTTQREYEEAIFVPRAETPPSDTSVSIPHLPGQGGGTTTEATGRRRKPFVFGGDETNDDAIRASGGFTFSLPRDRIPNIPALPPTNVQTSGLTTAGVDNAHQSDTTPEFTST